MKPKARILLVKENDGLPTTICSKCISQLKSSYAFKKLCEDSFKTLLQYTHNVDRTHIKIEVTDVLSDDETKNIDSFEYELKLEKEEMDIDNSTENFAEDSKSDCKMSITENHIKNIEENHSIDNNIQKISNTGGKVYDPISQRTRKDLKNVSDILGVDVYSLQLKNRQFQCNICSQIIKSRKPFVRHLERHLGVKTEFCEICQKYFSHSNYHSHNKLNSLKKQYPCDKCDKAFSYKSGLNNHLKDHNDENPYQCKVCGKTFKRLDRLRAHEQIHVTQKNFLCQYCPKAFAREKNLSSHLLSHSSERNFECGKCKKKFKTGTFLRIHEKIHSGIKKFQCKFCDKLFYNNSSLSTHTVTHTNTRMHECRVCSTKFKRSDHRNRHEMTAHGFNNRAQKLIEY